MKHIDAVIEVIEELVRQLAIAHGSDNELVASIEDAVEKYKFVYGR